MNENQSNALLASIVESTDDVIVSKTLDGIITSWNPAAERIFGYTKDEAIGQSIMLIIPHQRRSEESLILEKIRSGEKVDHFETVRMSKSGRLIPMSITVSPIKDEEGIVIGASKVARDITERKKIEQLMMEEAHKKDEFIAILAHELRNPLAPVKNAIALLNLSPSRDVDDQYALNVIDRQMTHMARLIDDLLDISRITANKLELKKEVLALESAFNLALETSRPTINESGLNFKVELPDERAFINADPVRISQVISNLLHNACKYTPEGGSISLVGEANSQEVIITVKDSGVGIAPEHIAQVFELFAQPGTTKTGTKGGLGIGLALVRKLVELHGGTVSVESQGVGFGSVFTVRLPRMMGQASQAHYKRSALMPHAAFKLLIVDDNKDSADTLTLVWRSLGSKVQVAYDGLEAVEIAKAFKPDVVLLDIGMPKLNGYEVAHILRQEAWGKKALIIATTGWGQESDKNRSREVGINHHLVKPVDSKRLEEIITDFLKMHTTV